MSSRMPRGRFVAILGILLAIAIVVSSIGAPYPHDWMIENALVLVAGILLISTYRSLPLSRFSYGLIFIFLCLHETGAHWTYAEVPYNDWWQSFFGVTLNEVLGLERNHFDRLVHFSYGLLIAYPIREVFMRVADVRGFWGYFLPLELVMSTSMIFELFEWAAAEVFGGELGIAYLGTQRDVWDAHKDMALATLGAIIAMTIIALINARYKRDFTREFRDSLVVKHPEPLGEEALDRMRQANQ